MSSHEDLTSQGIGHPLAAYGWTAEPAVDVAPLAEVGLVPGRVVRVDPGRCDVLVAEDSGAGVRTVRAETGPVLDPDPVNCPCTGNWAAVDLVAPSRYAVA
ncbi:hypothetical protein [Streptomyces sp. NPDC049040]|uniref:hypothetical protein n=1 Tax=Streptomyces sp. NPDC049040 TaxID=3365593 RepID=UPI003716C197